MDAKPADRARHAALIRKPGPVRRLTAAEVQALQHKRNLERYLKGK